MSELVKNQSQGYGYTYASLADFHKQGIDIPKMRTVVNEFGEFVEYLDDKGQWQQGARVVSDFQSKGMNAAQAYGSALTYARRYTVALAKAVATDDDVNVENAKPVKSSGGSTKKSYKLDFAEVRAKLKEIDDLDALTMYWESLELSDAQARAIKNSFTKRKEELNGVE